MIKSQKNRTIFLLILIQTILSVAAGLVLTFLLTYNKIPSGVYVDHVYVGGISRQEAAKKLDQPLKDAVGAESFKIKFGNKTYKIKYSDIDGVADSQATADAAYGSGNIFASFFAGTFSSKKKEVSPVISFNEGKLREKLSEFNMILNRNRKNASIHAEGNKIIRIPETLGYRFNMKNAIAKIRKDISQHIGCTIKFKVSNNYEISTLVPSVTLKDFNGIDSILAQYTTKISDMDNMDSIKKAVSLIDSTKLYSLHSENGRGSVFSFNKCLQAGNLLKSQSDEGYNQVASTLYAAALIAGIDQNTITRSPHEETVDYIDPGLDVSVTGDSGDFNFQNTLPDSIVICAEIKGDQITVSILGKKQDDSVNMIKTEVEQKYAPTVINMENQDLKPGQKKMISPGKQGLKVNVYRVTLSENQEIDKQLLYYDQYKPIDAVVQIGPNTDWYDDVVSK